MAMEKVQTVLRSNAIRVMRLALLEKLGYQSDGYEEDGRHYDQMGGCTIYLHKNRSQIEIDVDQYGFAVYHNQRLVKSCY